MYKVSKYNLKIKVNNEQYLFNTLTTSLIKAKENFIGKLATIITEPQSAKELKKLSEMGYIVQKNLDEVKILELKFQKSKFDNQIMVIDSFPSFNCNLNCEYCTLKSRLNTTSSKLSISKYFDNLFKFVYNSVAKKVRINFFGGEPLLCINEISSFIQLLRLNVKKEISTSLITNGTLLSKNNIQQVLDSKFQSIQFTIDGDAELHNSIKKSNSAYQNVINGINLIINSKYKGKIAIRLNISSINSYKLERILLDLKTNISNISDQRLFVYPAFINDTNKVVNNSYCVTEKNHSTFENRFYEECKKLNINYNLSLIPSNLNCSFFRESSMSIDPDLKIYKCIDLVANPENTVGEIKDGRLVYFDYDKKNSLNYAMQFSESLLEREHCKNCVFLPLCSNLCPFKTSTYPECQEKIKENIITFIKHGNNMRRRRNL